MKRPKIELDRESEVPLNRQLYDELRRLILKGTLKPGDRIPSTRDFADELGVSRPTIATCLEQLVQEGYVEVKAGSGTYVSPQLHNATLPQPKEAPAKTLKASGYSLSDYGKFISKMPSSSIREEEPEISFYCWRPALDQFPLIEWARVIGRHARSSDVSMLDTNFDPQGSHALRDALAGLVKRFRGVSCDAEQIIPVVGLNQGLDLVARLHLEAGSHVVVEDPGFTPATFKAIDVNLLPVPVDEQGMRVDRLPSLESIREKSGQRKNGQASQTKIDLVYLTPARQFPTGGVMPLSRRLAFLEWARKCGTLVLEDDYDSEYQASGKPIPALMSLDKDQRVIYLGTLNQLMFPSLALGYLIVPPQLVPMYRQARGLAGDQLPPHIQAAVTDFINEGHLDRHVKKLRSLYSERRSVLVDELQKRFGEKVSIGPNRSGVSVLVSLNVGLSEDEIVARAARAGVGLTSTREFYLTRVKKSEFIMGIGSLNEAQIKKGVRRLATVLK